MTNSCRWMGESGKRVKPVSTKFSQQKLCSSDRTSDRSWDSHTIVVLCMTKTCRWMGEHYSDAFGIPSRHEQRSRKRGPAPELVARDGHLWVFHYLLQNGTQLGAGRNEQKISTTITPTKGHVFAAIVECVFIGYSDFCLTILVHKGRAIL